MRAVSYVITVNGVEVPSATYTNYEEVVTAVKALNEDAGRTKFGYTTKLTTFDPEDTPERRAQALEHVRKAQEYRAQKRAQKGGK